MFRYTGVTSVALRDREKAKTGKLLLVMISRDTKRSSHSLFIPFLFIYLFIIYWYKCIIKQKWILWDTSSPIVQNLQSYSSYLWILRHKYILPWKVRTRPSRRSITNVTHLLISESLKNPGIQTRKYVGTFNQRRLSSTVFSRLLLAKEQKLWKETECQNYGTEKNYI